MPIHENEHVGEGYDALLNMEPEITLPESVRKRAEIPILRMLELSK